MAGANAPTLSGLRAIGDRLAVRTRFHDATAYRDHLPPEMPASGVFSALELARLDVLGVGWLPGIARNLMAHPGAENDGVRWLAFELMGGRIAPGEKAVMAGAVTRAA
jgi:cobalamin biosynthesis protein CobT